MVKEDEEDTPIGIFLRWGAIVMTKMFFDTHMHAMNLVHPDFVSFVDSVANGFAEFVVSGSLSPGYLLTPANRGQQGLITVMNLFNVFERSIDEIFLLIEDDLSGKFFRQEEDHKNKPSHAIYPETPYISNNKFIFRSQAYDKYALIPLVMDFSSISNEWGKGYYTRVSHDKLLSYVEDTLEGMEKYRKTRPEGLLEFFPFLGINPEAHPIHFIEYLLDTYIRKNRSYPYRIRKRDEKRQFWGVKLYPPLGMDPWPKTDKIKLSKVEYIYSFCEAYDIPIITHCDDQGFRGVTAKLAQKFTDPASWRIVLEQYPQLRIDFAHYGKQYKPMVKPSLKKLLENSIVNEPWFNEIISLMDTYEHVYADFSFTGADHKFYEQLKTFIEGQGNAPLSNKILHRSMFGSDFSVNLSKVESYTNYMRIFETSPFSDDAVELFGNKNPLEFLGLKRTK
ncbi:MAG: amidohydrolase family protein [Sphaerochaetaceae bacterium]